MIKIKGGIDGYVLSVIGMSSVTEYIPRCLIAIAMWYVSNVSTEESQDKEAKSSSLTASFGELSDNERSLFPA